ncbi:caspase-3-like [Diadema antillarum]|uniref:caspase-3-like n=1 Tax=Diadema antillarum TaxID=105358 RepID=UPI003A8C6B64
MEKRHRALLRSRLPDLATDIDTDLVCQKLISKRIFQPHHVEEFLSKSSKMARNQALLMDLETRGPNAFHAFVESLVEANQVYLAELLGYIRPTIRTETGSKTFTSKLSAFVVKAPWPAPGSPGDLSTDKMTSSPDSSSYRNLNDTEKVYRMSAQPRGHAVIINNKNFRTRKTRKGTDIDRNNLKNVFRQLYFNVTVYEDLTSRAIMQCLRALSRRSHLPYDCLIVAILSHGELDVVYGTDDEVVAITDLVDLFNPKRCPTLAGKPKLFFVQACRGDKFDEGVDDTDSTMVTSSDQAGGTVDSIAQGLHKMDLEDSSTSSGYKLPTQSDVLLAYATVPGFVSWRNADRGSWFVQALTEVFLRSAHSQDLLSMMTEVNNLVARAFESDSGRYKQMPAPQTMLTKKLFFFPGYSEDLPDDRKGVEEETSFDFTESESDEEGN